MNRALRVQHTLTLTLNWRMAMNQDTVRIAEYIASKHCACTLAQAAEIQLHMVLDFSECSQAEFIRAIEYSFEEIGSFGCTQS